MSYPEHTVTTPDGVRSCPGGALIEDTTDLRLPARRFVCGRCGTVIHAPPRPHAVAPVPPKGEEAP